MAEISIPDPFDEHRRLIDEGLDSIDRGDVIDIESDDEEERFFEQLLDSCGHR